MMTVSYHDDNVSLNIRATGAPLHMKNQWELQNGILSQLLFWTLPKHNTMQLWN